jgi:glycosyltransferase involved in cell wall biosynthesis
MPKLLEALEDLYKPNIGISSFRSHTMSSDIMMVFSLPASAGIFYYNLELLRRIKASYIRIMIVLPARWEHYASRLILREIKTLIGMSKGMDKDIIFVSAGLPKLPHIFSIGFREFLLFYNFLQIGTYGDIIHFTWPQRNYYLKILKGLNKKVVSVSYDIIPLKLPKLYPWPRFKRNVDFWKKSDAVIAISENTKKDLISLGFNDEKIFVIYPGVDTQLFRPIPKNIARRELGLSLDKRVLLYVGSLEPKRAVPVKALLQTYKSLLKRYKDIVLILAGPFKYVYEKIAGDIIILHNVLREKLPFLYASADVFVFPTLYEGFGMPPLEAIACGTPVIAPLNSSLPEVIGDAGIYVENPLDAKAWYESIKMLLEDEDLRSYLSKKSVLHAQNFSWDRSAEVLGGVYEILSKR